MSQEEKIRQLVRWNSTDAEAIAQQLLERVRREQKEGKTVGVVICVVTASEEGGAVTYDPAFSTLPSEVIAWAGDVIRREIVRIQTL